jgi:Sigma-70, region 4/ClpX C4-type zinc finger
MSEDDKNFNPEKLTAREAKVLLERFGIHLLKESSLEDIGRQFDETRKRIKEIEEKALKKLKAKRDKKQNQNCSFCGKSVSDVKRIIKSEISNVYIYDECIKTCGDLLDNQ